MATSTTSAPVTSVSAAPLASSTSFQTSLTTEAPLAIFTTPYVFPTDCSTTLYNISVAERQIDGVGAHYYETFLYIPEHIYDRRSSGGYWQPASYEHCFRPAGATRPFGHEGNAESAVYRGAVCPSGYVALEVGLASESLSYSQLEAGQVASTWSTANCCASGDALVSDIWFLGYQDTLQNTFSACAFTSGDGADVITAMPYSTWRYFNATIVSDIRVVSTWTTTHEYYKWEREDILSTIFWLGGRMFYPPWSMEWTAEDNATLDPPWPTLTSDMLIPTWSPGQWVASGGYDNKGRGRAATSTAPANAGKLGKVGLPVVATLAALLGLLLLGVLVFWLLRRRRAKRRRVKASSEGELELNSVPGEGHEGAERLPSSGSSMTRIA